MNTINNTQVDNIDITNSQGIGFKGYVFTGGGLDFLKVVSSRINQDGSFVLDSVINNLLVNKGIDWSGTILNEYLNIFKYSTGTFSLVWDLKTEQFVAHGAVFQSKKDPEIGLVAHIRTHESFKYLGFGTLVTENVTRAGFENNASIILLATDDKLNRIESGEKAAYSLYSKIGYSILAEKTMIDTVDWLMIIDKHIFNFCQQEKKNNHGKFPPKTPEYIKQEQYKLIKKIRNEFYKKKGNLKVQKVTDGDLAGLFCLLTLCPEVDFKVKLDSWDVHYGPEIERSFVVNIRPALLDLNRLEDGSLLLRDTNGLILAVCSAKLAAPFSKNRYKIDFYCFPEFLTNNQKIIYNFIKNAIKNLQNNKFIPKPCYLSFCGVDKVKISIFENFNFKKTGNSSQFYKQNGTLDYETYEYIREM